MTLQQHVFLAGAACTLLFSCRASEPAALCPDPSFHLLQNPCIAPCDPGIVNTSKETDTYLWYFDDGASSDIETPTHTFTQPGEYIIALRAYGNSTICEDSAELHLVVTDSCGFTKCWEHGDCRNGICVCSPGWEGPECTETYSQKFTGKYSQRDTCGTASSFKNDFITINSIDEKTIALIRFGSYIDPVDLSATVDKDLPDAPSAREMHFSFTDSAGVKISGSGIKTGRDIIGNYILSYPDNTSQSCRFRLLAY